MQDTGHQQKMLPLYFLLLDIMERRLTWLEDMKMYLLKALAVSLHFGTFPKQRTRFARSNGLADDRQCRSAPKWLEH